MAINDAFPLRKTGRRDDIANWKFLGPRDISHLISMVPFTFAMRHHLIPLYGRWVKTPALFSVRHIFSRWEPSQN